MGKAKTPEQYREMISTAMISFGERVGLVARMRNKERIIEVLENCLRDYFKVEKDASKTVDISPYRTAMARQVDDLIILGNWLGGEFRHASLNAIGLEMYGDDYSAYRHWPQAGGRE